MTYAAHRLKAKPLTAKFAKASRRSQREDFAGIGSAGILPARLLFKKGGRDARRPAGETPALLNERAAIVPFFISSF